MTGASNRSIEELLAQAAAGRGAAAEELVPLVYEQLRALAANYLRRERQDHTLQPTALVNEAFLQLNAETRIGARSKRQFFALASTMMRNILVNHAVRKGREKRGSGWNRITLDEADAPSESLSTLEIVALDDALSRLAELDARKARLVELRFFAGLSHEDAAQVLGVSRTTVAEDWRFAKAWLRRELKEE